MWFLWTFLISKNSAGIEWQLNRWSTMASRFWNIGVTNLTFFFSFFMANSHQLVFSELKGLFLKSLFWLATAAFCDLYVAQGGGNCGHTQVWPCLQRSVSLHLEGDQFASSRPNNSQFGILLCSAACIVRRRRQQISLTSWTTRWPGCNVALPWILCRNRSWHPFSS